MNKILILFAHPRFEKSKTSRALLKNINKREDVTLNDLYEKYPDFNIDVEKEKELLISHQVIIWHHPLYMYSAPAMLKQWIDLVLEYGWAHGREGNFLKDKIIFNAVTVGGTREVYAAEGYNRYTIREFFLPFEQTAALCKMIYLPPFAVHGTHLLTPETLTIHSDNYNSLLDRLSSGDYNIDEIKKSEYLNDWLLLQKGSEKI